MARDLHNQAEIAREKEQDSLKALKLLDEALIEYLNEKNYYGASDSFGSKQIVFSHLYQSTKNKAFLLLAIQSAKTSVLLAEEYKEYNALSRAYFNLAKAYEYIENYSEAVKTYEQAFKNFDKNPPPEFHNTPAIKSDMKAHMACSKYMSGDKSALNLMNEAITELEKFNDNTYAILVWLSGAHMRTANMLSSDNKSLALEHVKKAEEIINNNSELNIRKTQLEELKQKLNI